MVRVERDWAAAGFSWSYCRQRLDCPRLPGESGRLERQQARLLIPGGGSEGRKSGEELGEAGQKKVGEQKEQHPAWPSEGTQDPGRGPPGGQQIPFLQRTCPASIKSLSSCIGPSWLSFLHSGFSEPQFSYP